MATFPANTFPTPNRVVVVGRGREDELPCSSSLTNLIYPGMLLMDDGAGNVQPHNVAGGVAELMFALEQGLIGLAGMPGTTGKGTFDAYDAGSRVQFYRAAAGDKLNVLLANGQNAAEGNYLGSDGAGHLKVIPSAQLGGNLYETTAASTALTNTITETVFSNGSYSIPANFLQAGDILHVRAQGIATATNATDTLNAKLYLGGLTGTNIVATGALDVANGDEFLIDAYIEFRTIGASGTFIANGTDVIGTPGTATAKPFLLGSTAVDTTAAQAIAVSGTWSVANAGDSCRLDYMTVDLIRQSGSITPLLVVDTAYDNTAGTGTTYPYSPAALVLARVLR